MNYNDFYNFLSSNKINPYDNEAIAKISANVSIYDWDDYEKALAKWKKDYNKTGYNKASYNDFYNFLAKNRIDPNDSETIAKISANVSIYDWDDFDKALKNWETEYNSKSYQDKKHRLDQIREDNDIRSLSGLASAFGIPIPDKILTQSKQYTRASSEWDRIMGTAQSENRDLTSDEKSKLANLEETMEKTKGAHEVLEKMGPTIGALGTAATVATPAITLLVSAIKKMDKAGADAADRIQKVQDSMSLFGETINSTHNEISSLQAQINTSKENIKKYKDDVFGSNNEGSLIIKNWFYNLIESFWAGRSESISDIPDTYTSKYTGDSYFRNYYDTAKSKGWDKYISEDTFYSIFGNTSNDMFDSGITNLNSVAGITQMLTTLYLNSKAYRLSDKSPESILSNMDELTDLMINGGINGSLGVALDDDIMSGYSIKEYGISFNNLNKYNQMRMRLRLMSEQLSKSNRESVMEEAEAYKELGMSIGDAAGQLLSFDKAEVLNSVNPNMPDTDSWFTSVFGTNDEFIDSLKEVPDIALDVGNQIADNLYKSIAEGVDKASEHASRTLAEIFNDPTFTNQNHLTGPGSLEYLINNSSQNNDIQKTAPTLDEVIASYDSGGRTSGGFSGGSKKTVNSITDSSSNVFLESLKDATVNTLKLPYEILKGMISMSTPGLNYAYIYNKASSLVGDQARKYEVNVNLNDTVFLNDESKDALAIDLKNRLDVIEQRGG